MRLDPSDSFVPSHPQEGDSYESTNVSKPVNDSGPTMDEPVDIDTKTDPSSTIAEDFAATYQSGVSDETTSIKINRTLWDQVRRQSTQSYSDLEDEDLQQVLHVSVEAALKTEYKGTVSDAVKKKLLNMIDNDLWATVDYDTIAQKVNIIPSHMFIKFKHKPDGSFDKTKARLVVQGNHEPKFTISLGLI